MNRQKGDTCSLFTQVSFFGTVCGKDHPASKHVGATLVCARLSVAHRRYLIPKEQSLSTYSRQGKDQVTRQGLPIKNNWSIPKGKPLRPSTNAERQISSAVQPPTDKIVESQSLAKYTRSGPQVTVETKTVPLWTQEASKSMEQRRQQTVDRKISIRDSAKYGK